MKITCPNCGVSILTPSEPGAPLPPRHGKRAVAGLLRAGRWLLMLFGVLHILGAVLRLIARL